MTRPGGTPVSAIAGNHRTSRVEVAATGFLDAATGEFGAGTAQIRSGTGPNGASTADEGPIALAATANRRLTPPANFRRAFNKGVKSLADHPPYRHALLKT